MKRFATSCLALLAACSTGGSGYAPVGGLDLAIATRDLPGALPDLAGPADLAVPSPDLATAPPDLSVTPPDLAKAPPDLASPVAATLNDINTGRLAQGARVRVTGMVVTGMPLFDGVTKTTNKCKYIAFAQDPGGQAPCGIKLFVLGATCSAGDGGACKCPYPPMSGTPLDGISALGDQLTVVGDVNVFMGQHEIVVDQVTRTAQGKAVAAIVALDGAEFAANGAGYVKYENMLMRFQPLQKFTVGALDMFGGFNGGGAHFSGNYRAFYGMNGAFPAANSTWRAITGIADPAFGGGLAAREQNDFIP